MSFARGGRRLEPGRGRALFRHPGSPRRRIRRHPVGRRSRLRHPTRFGNLSSQLKQFLDTLGGVWVQGLLVGDSSRFARAAPSGRYGLCNDRRQQHLGGSARRGGRHRRAHGCERLTSCSARSVELRRVLPPGSCQELRYVRRPHRRPPGGAMAARYPADRPADRSRTTMRTAHYSIPPEFSCPSRKPSAFGCAEKQQGPAACRWRDPIHPN